MIPKPHRDDRGRVQGEFYPLQKPELIALRKSKLINNAGFVHLALRYENPFCDRPITVIPKEFAMRWQIPESSVYEAIARLKENHAVNIKSGKVTIEWSDSQEEEINDSQQADDSENPEKLWESRKNSDSPEKITEVRKNYGSPEKILEVQKIESQNPYPIRIPALFRLFRLIQTLSNLPQMTRERFLNFCLSKINSLEATGFVVHTHDGWIESHYDQYWKEFCSINNLVQTNQHIAGQQNSTNVQNFETWNASTHEGQYHTLISVGLAKFCENATSQGWYEWARAKHPERFIEVPE